ncbi:rhodanese-like domain-containing protein [Mongoliibacter ruber]|uniref:tRNA 2-selenouridine synthase n=1 Tax=Mongoliibacter ruber TaxID=1750599 RepID=A0A2T0WW67_9BACT|nr:rhodanese-like domain-containing protein [Mongoliibacter ruber]PRY90943.1 tRNA 2-selenouridine synthase [Mongoliibacter ruber]
MRQPPMILDLRKTSLFEKGHIPGAINFPMFEIGEIAQVQKMTVEEREGFYFKRSKALGAKLVDLVGFQAFSYYCQKGEMESRFFKNWFGPEFLEGKVLKGGYNAYRKAVNQSWNEKYNLIVLTGLTGSGKTEVLENLENEGVSVLNIEKIAGHKGSVFGTIDGESNIPQEQFENEIHQILRKRGPVFTEMKGRYIGTLYIPIQLFRQMEEAPKVFLELPLKARIDRLVKTYCGKDDEFLKKQLMQLKDRLSDQELNSAMEDLNKFNYRSFIERLLGYYDESNVYGESVSNYQMKISGKSPKEILVQLKKAYPL